MNFLSTAMLLLALLGLGQDELDVAQPVVVRRGAALGARRERLVHGALVGGAVGDDEALLVEPLVLGVGLGRLQNLQEGLGDADRVAAGAEALPAAVVNLAHADLEG